MRRFAAETADGERELQTVVGERAGFSNRRILVLAHRDALGRGARARAVGHRRAARARARARRPHARAARSCSPRRAAAPPAWRRRSGWRENAAERGPVPVDAVLVLGDLAGTRIDRPLVVPWSRVDGARAARAAAHGRVGADGARRGLRAGTDRRPGVQLARLAFPLTLGEQGPFDAHGLGAVLLSASGERAPAADAPVSAERLTAFGRAALRSIGALDGGGDLPGSEPYVAARAQGAAGVAGAAARDRADAAGAARRRRRVRARAPPPRAGRHVAALGRARARCRSCSRRCCAIGLFRTGLIEAAPAAPVAGAASAPNAAALASVRRRARCSRWFGLRPLLLRLLGVEGDAGRAGGAATADRARAVRGDARRVDREPVREPAADPGAAPVAAGDGARDAPAPPRGARAVGGRPAAAAARRLRARAPVRARSARARVDAGCCSSPAAGSRWRPCSCGASCSAAPPRRSCVVLRASRRRPSGRPRRRSPCAGRRRTPGPARSAAPSRRCGDEPARAARSDAAADEARAAGDLDRADRGGRADDRRRGRHARVAGAGLGAARADRAEQALRRARRASRQSRPTRVQRRVLAALRDADDGGSRSSRARRAAPRETGEPIGRIEIPAIGADFVVVQGTDSATLRKGPGHYPSTTVPRGCGGTVAIAGHRTTYLAPFRNVDDLKHGDRIVLTMPYGRFTYARRAHADRRARRAVGHAETSATSGSCCPPATRSTARRSGSSCSRGSSGSPHAARPCDAAS